MAKASEQKLSEEDRKAAQALGAELKQGGVKMPDSQSQGKATDTPSHDKDSANARAKVRDLPQEQGSKQPEGVRVTHTSWRDQVKAHREQSQANTAEPAKEHQATATKQPGQEQARQPEKQQGKEPEKPGWKEVKAAPKAKEQEGGKDKGKQQDRGQEQER